jgi:hypothetical protein
MRLARIALAVTAAVAAGCSSGHAAATRPAWARHAGVYSAIVVTDLLHPLHRESAAPPQRILLDTATGRFRMDTSGGPRLHGFTLHAAYDGRVATQVFGTSGRAQVTAYRGSRSFIIDRLGGTDVRVVRAFLTGGSPPASAHVRIVGDGPPARLVVTTGRTRMQISIAAVHGPSTGAFSTARGHVVSTVRQLRPGTAPRNAIPAYWLGPSWNGRTADRSSATSGQDASYTIAYPHLAVEADAEPLPGLSGDQALTLADGTRATLAVVHPNTEGTYSLNADSTSTYGVIALATGGTGKPGPIALVFLPNAMITLSGSAVTDASALAIARALRPL